MTGAKLHLNVWHDSSVVRDVIDLIVECSRESLNALIGTMGIRGDCAEELGVSGAKPLRVYRYAPLRESEDESDGLHLPSEPSVTKRGHITFLLVGALAILVGIVLLMVGIVVGRQYPISAHCWSSKHRSEISWCKASVRSLRSILTLFRLTSAEFESN